MHLLTTAAALAVTMIVLVACSSEEHPAPEATTHEMPLADDNSLGHIHGLGVDPADDTLYVASHHGVFRVVGGQPERVADRWQDTMGFAVIGPGHFLGSGHPDPDETLPSSLGLIESTDAGRTWEPVSLQGDADFHALEAVGDYLYGLDSHTGSLLVTTDRTNWEPITQQPLLDLAANPADPQTIYAITERGRLVRSTGHTDPELLETPALLTAIDWQPGGPLVGVTPDGVVMVSTDAETGWQEVGTLDGQVAAVDAAPGRWHAATATGVYESTNDGATWTRVLSDSH